MRNKLNILTIYREPKNIKDFFERHIFFLRKYYPEHHYVYHEINQPFDSSLMRTQWDAVLLDVTFLCIRYNENLLETFKTKYSFLANMGRCRIAFPQDDYDCNEILDNWMCDWNIDIVYSPLSNNLDVLYPNFHTKGQILLSYTGYIDDDHYDMLNNAKTYHDRLFDISYRAKKLPYYFGRIGRNKWEIANIFVNKAKNTTLRYDIAVGVENFIEGTDWVEMLRNSRFTLGARSGSSLLDPHRRIQSSVKEYMSQHPDATFEEVEEKFFPGLDGKYIFTALSPRNIESAFNMTSQVLVEGNYSDLLQPWVHYIPLAEDASNFDEVYQAMLDEDIWVNTVTNTIALFKNTSKLHYSSFAKEVLNKIKGFS